jgi:hypothetical protein
LFITEITESIRSFDGFERLKFVGHLTRSFSVWESLRNL